VVLLFNPTEQWKFSRARHFREYQIGTIHGRWISMAMSIKHNTTVNTSTGSVSGVTIAFPKATALIYGSVKIL